MILSPTFSEHFASIVSANGSDTGKGLILGPLSTSILSISFSSAGGTIILSFIVNFSGNVISAASPSVLGSVNTPVRAEIAAVSGDTR